MPLPKCAQNQWVCENHFIVLDLLAGLISSPPKPLRKKQHFDMTKQYLDFFAILLMENRFFLPTCTVFCHLAENKTTNEHQQQCRFCPQLTQLEKKKVFRDTPTIWWMFFNASTHSEETMSSTVLQDRNGETTQKNETQKRELRIT